MRALLPLLLCIACAEDLAVHVRAGDRPPTPEYLVIAGGVDVDHFQVAVRNLRLQSSPTDGGVSTPDETVVGPEVYLIDLQGPQLTGGDFTPLIQGFPVDAKGYFEMDIDLSPVTAAEATLNTAMAPLVGKTFQITGRDAHGTPFALSSSAPATLIRAYTFRMGKNHNNIDINVAPNTWFTQADGGALEPLSTDPAVRAEIEANVMKSIDAYEDDNYDGIPDPLG